MDFFFQLSDYNDPALDAETAELLRQRLEAYSRQTVPGMWKVTDRLNANPVDAATAARRRKRYRIYGVLLIALGIFALVPGLMEPRIPSLILTGGLAILAGLLEFWLTRKKKGLAPPASCKKEAAELLRVRRETDWKTLQAEVRFDVDGWSVTTAEGESRTAYDKLRNVFESERLWMLVYEKDMALLLQKKDLVSGEAADFLPFLREKLAD